MDQWRNLLYLFILPYMKYIVLKRLPDFTISKPSFSCTLKIHRIAFPATINRPQSPCFIPEDASQFGWINCELRKHHRLCPEKISQASKVYVAKICNSFPSWALTYPDFWVVLMILGSEVMSKGKTLEMESCLCAQDCLRLHMTHAEGTWDGT